MMDFVLIATLSVKLWHIFITFAPVKNYVLRSPQKISNTVKKEKHSKMKSKPEICLVMFDVILKFPNIRKKKRFSTFPL